VRFNMVYRFQQRVAWLDKAAGWLVRKMPEQLENAFPATDQEVPPKGK
jgi:hypothetical protein